MKLLRELIVYALIGVGIGNIITLVFSLSYGNYIAGVPMFINNFPSVNNAVTVQTLIYAVLGILQGVASKILKDVEMEYLLKKLIIHYSLIILPLLLAGYYLKWFINLNTFILMVIFTSIIYILIAVISYLSIKEDIRKINNKLEK